MTAVISAGGKGTRLKDLTKEIPKPLIPLRGKPVLAHQVLTLKENGISDFIFLIGHLGDAIIDYFGNGEKWDISIKYYKEEFPLGTAGALHYIKEWVNDSFIFAYGDVVFDVDIQRLVKFHKEKNSLATLVVHPNNHPYDSDLVILDKEDRVTGFLLKKGNRPEFYSNMVNSGLFVFSPEILPRIRENEKQDLEKEIINNLTQEGRVFGYRTCEYLKDMGTLDRLDLVSGHIQQGLVSGGNLRKKQKAVFIDRDGTLNKKNGLIHKTDQFELEESAIEAIKLLNSSPFLAVLVTNQPVIARNLCSLEELDYIHKKMETLLGKDGCYLDGIYFCPHHPDKGYPEERKEYKIMCDCRKPGIGMIKQAEEDFNLDLSECWIIGDTTSDIKAGNNAGMKSILVKTGDAGEDGKYDSKADSITSNIFKAVQLIVGD